MHILICTDGTVESLDTVRMISGLGLHAGARITLLGLGRRDEPQDQLTRTLDEMASRLEGAAEELLRIVKFGSPEDQILEEARQRNYDLVAVSAHERRRRFHFTLGSTAAILARRLRSPFLVTRNMRDEVRRVLFSTGGEAPSLDTLRQGARFLRALELDATVLHVMSQVALRLDSPADDLEATADRAMERSTREGQHFKAAIGLLQEAGFRGSIKPSLRHGLVVDEVIEEIQEGGYDLLVIGSHFRPDSSRWMEFLLDDISEQLLARAPCSVLIVRPQLNL